MQNIKKKNQLFYTARLCVITGTYIMKSYRQPLKATEGNDVWTGLNDVWLKIEKKTTFQHNIETFTSFTADTQL